MACVAPLNCGDCAQVGGGGNAALRHVALDTCLGKGKGKVFPYSLPSVGPGADPGAQAVSPQVT